MYVAKRVILIVIILLMFSPILSSQEAPKKPVKITEESVNQICNDAINNSLSEERPRLIEETKKIVEEAIKASEEDQRKRLEETEQRILEKTSKNTEERAKAISEETTRTRLEEYSRKKAEEEKIQAATGPGFVYDEDTTIRFYFENLIRSEISTNLTDYNSNNDDSEMKILERAVFGGGISYKNRLFATYKLRHTQIWGAQGQNPFITQKNATTNIPRDTIFSSIYKGNYGVGTYEAFIEIGNFREIPLLLSAGLMQLHYGDGRVLSSNGKWFIESEPFTAAVVRYSISKHQLHLIYTKMRETEVLSINGRLYNTPGDDMLGLYFLGHLTDDISLDGYMFYNRIGATPTSTSGKDINIGTVGVRTDSTFRALKLNGELIFQFGKNRERDHIAGAADLNLTYHIPANTSPYLRAGFAYATGDSGSKDKSLQFLQPYASNEGRYGILNMTALSNIILPQATIGLSPISRLNISLSYYYFILASSKGELYDARYNLSLYDPTGKSGRDLGWESDIVAKFRYNRYLTISAGYALSQPMDYQINQTSYIYSDTRGYPVIFGNDLIHYAYGMINLNF